MITLTSITQLTLLNVSRIAVDRYFNTRPGAGEAQVANQQQQQQHDNEYEQQQQQQYEQQQQQQQAEEEQQAMEQETFEFNHPLMVAVFSGENVEVAEQQYIAELMETEDFLDLPDQVKTEVMDDLAQELSQRLIDAETEAQSCSTEVEFQKCIAGAIEGFDAMAKLVAEHVQSLKGELHNNGMGGGGGE